MDQKIYNYLFKHLDYEINTKGLQVEASEIISEAYLQLSEEGVETSFLNLKERCNYLKFRKPKFYVYKGQPTSNGTSKVCPKCNQDIPFGYFGTTFNKAIEDKSIQSYCRDCAKEYMKRYFEKNRILINYKMRERFRYDKENLTDAYIKRVLRRRGWLTEDITPNAINHTRKELQKLPKGKRMSHKRIYHSQFK